MPYGNYGNGTDGPVVKITAFSYKLPDVTKEEFDYHWRKHHVEKFLKNPEVKKRMLGYVQCHVDNELMAEMSAWPHADYDGMAEFYVRSLQDWIDISTTPQFLAEVIPDHKYFVDESKMKIIVTNVERVFWNMS